jgi:hypothetical protein
MKSRNLHPNPFDPTIDTLSVWLFPEVLADKDGPLCPGSEDSQSERFSTVLGVALKAHGKEANNMGHDILEIGVHSARKGATTCISSGAACAPSSTSFNLRGGWSMGSVRDVRTLHAKVGDQCVGSLAAGLPALSENCAVSNPDFVPVQENEAGLFAPVSKTPEIESELRDENQIVLEGMFGQQIPNAIRPLLRTGLACHLHHQPKLDEAGPNDSALRLTALFTSQLAKDMQRHVKVGFPCDKNCSMCWEEPTGTPPHVIELAKLAELKRMVGETLQGFQKILTEQLDAHAVNGVLSESRARALMEGVLDDRVAPLVAAMAANREGGGTRPPAAQERPPGAIEETVGGFCVFNNHGKLRRIPEDWKFPHCPLAAAHELHHSGDEVRGRSPIKMLEKSHVDCLKRCRQNLCEFKCLMAKNDEEAARLGKDVSHGTRAHCKSISFLCKGALEIPRLTKKGGRGGSKRSLGPRQLRLLGLRQGVDLNSTGLTVQCVLTMHACNDSLLNNCLLCHYTSTLALRFYRGTVATYSKIC